MTDDRSLERAARSWLDEGPVQAPDHTVDAALSQIQTLSQERDLGIPWRLPTMNPIIRLAGIALIALIAVGGAALALRPAENVGPPATPSPSSQSVSEASAAALDAYRSARNAICADLKGQRIPDATDPADVAANIAFLRATISAATEEATRLSAMDVPPWLRDEHLANVQTVRDTVTLLNQEVSLLQAGKPDEANTVDGATGALGRDFEAFEAKYRLQDCPYG